MTEMDGGPQRDISLTKRGGWCSGWGEGPCCRLASPDCWLA